MKKINLNIFRKNILATLMFLTCFIFILLCFYSYKQEIKLTVIHTDVLYGHIKANLITEGPYKHQHNGGSSLIASQINLIRKEVASVGAQSLLLDAGSSLFEGTSASKERGKTVVTIMNEMKYDAMNIGNGELDFGTEVLAETIDHAKFPLLAANIWEAKSGKIPKYLNPYIIKNYQGLKVGILGITNPDMPVICSSHKIRGLKFGNHFNFVRKYIKEMKKQDVNFIIVLSDLWDIEKEIELAKIFQDDIQLIIGTSKQNETFDKEIRVGKIPIAKTPRKLKSVGRFDFTLDNNTKVIKDIQWKLYPIVSSRLQQNEKIQEIVESEFYATEKNILDFVIGYNGQEMPYETAKENAFGNFVCDILKKETGVDIALLNSAALRGLPIGEITNETLNKSIPYEEKVVIVKLNGKQLKEVLEKSFGRPEYNILQVSGITLKYDMNMPVGKRVWNVEINGTPLSDEQEYTIGTIAYLANGGDDFFKFDKVSQMVVHPSIRTLVKHHIKENRNIFGIIDGRLNKTAWREEEESLSPSNSMVKAIFP